MSARQRSALSFLLAFGLVLAIAAPATAGTAGALDTSFDGDGKVTTDFTGRADSAYAMALQSDGKIVVAGGAAVDGANARFLLARYNADGSLDTTFSGDGKATTDFTGRYDAAWGVAIQDDGKIVAAGDAGLGGSNSKFAVARFNADGTLDTSFGGDGKVVTDMTQRDDPVAGLALQSDGRILVSGGAGVGGRNAKFALARYNANGSLDTTFSGDGKVTTDLSNGLDAANAVAVQADTKIVALGLAIPRGARARFAATRYNSNGTLDTGFDDDGKVTTLFSNRASGQNLALPGDGTIVAAGGVGGSGGRFALVRYNSDGSLDASFSGDGRVTTNFTALEDSAWDVALQDNGQIVAVGDAGGGGGNPTWALARYNSDGSLDTSFDGDGRVTTDFTGRWDRAWGVAIQGDGNIVAAGDAGFGGSNPRVALARYLAA